MNFSAADTLAPRSGAQRIATPLLAIFQVAATLLPSVGIGEPIGDRSDVARTLITPAGWAFSIWGPLFAGSVAYAIYQVMSAQRYNGLLARIAWASAGAFLGNGLWALYAQFLGLSAGSVLIIVFTLLCLLHVYRTFTVAREPFTRAEQILVVLPLSALTAWLTAATIVNIAASLKYHGVHAGAWAPAVAAGIVVLGGLIASSAVWKGRGNPWYAGVFLWALAGILAAGGRDHAGVGVAVFAAALLVIASAVARLLRSEDRDRWFGGRYTRV